MMHYTRLVSPRTQTTAPNKGDTGARNTHSRPQIVTSHRERKCQTTSEPPQPTDDSIDTCPSPRHLEKKPLPVGWPVSVSCEMNISAWESALHKSNLIPEYQDVIEGFKAGFDQGIPDHVLKDTTSGDDLPYFCPPNHSSAFMAKDKIEQSLADEVKAGRMFGPFTREQISSVYPFFRSSPMGAVINGDGSLRPINDLSYPKNKPYIPSVNSFVDAQKFKTTWDDFKVVALFFRSSKDKWLLAIFDWEKAYRQIPTLMSQWRYLLVQDLDGHLYVDTRITFGGVAGCGSFGRPADAWKKVMIKEFDVFTAFRWVDDNLFVKRLMSPTSIEDITRRSQELGVLTNKKKCSDFKHEQKFIGFIWNGVEKTVRLPDDKLEQRKLQVKEFLAGKTFSYNQVEVLTGRLVHVSYILPQLRCYLNGLHRWKAAWVSRYAKQSLPDDAKEDLEYWSTTLNSFKNMRLLPITQPTEINWVGDASTSFGVAVIIGRKWSQFRLLDGWETRSSVKRGIAWLETVAIRIGLLMLIRLDWPKGQNLNVWTDNTTCEDTLRKRKSRDRSVNEEWKTIQQLLIHAQLDLNPLRVTSEDNKADALSRGIRTGHDEADRLLVKLPDDLACYLECTRSNESA